MRQVQGLRFGLCMGAVWVIIIGSYVLVAQPHYPGPSTLVKVPYSGAAWVPPDQATAQVTQSIEARLAALEAKIDKILKLLEDAAGPDPGGTTVAAPPQALIEGLGTCVGCHADRVAKQKGDAFILFQTHKGEDGKEQSLFREDFSKRELRNIQREVEEGLMPKKTSGKVLTPEQKAAILNEIKALVAKKDGEGN